MSADIRDCPRCGTSHFGLFVYRGHQGRSNYAFCPSTNKAVDVAVAPSRPPRMHDADAYEEWCAMSDAARYGADL